MDPPRKDADDTRVGAEDKRPPPTPTDDELADALFAKIAEGMQFNVHRRLRTLEKCERANTEGRYTLTALLALIFLLQLVTLVIALRK